MANHIECITVTKNLQVHSAPGIHGGSIIRKNNVQHIT